MISERYFPIQFEARNACGNSLSLKSQNISVAATSENILIGLGFLVMFCFYKQKASCQSGRFSQYFNNILTLLFY